MAGVLYGTRGYSIVDIVTYSFLFFISTLSLAFLCLAAFGTEQKENGDGNGAGKLSTPGEQSPSITVPPATQPSGFGTLQ
ncbi:MAG: hypothetical protein FJ218_02780 [Ignavibacteria bacterium]|nr:hypothetical protein [Ignavibacteria bacterium]